MQSPASFSKNRDWKRAVRTASLIGLSLLLANCGGGGGDGGGGGGGGPCDDPEIIVNECDAAGESCPSPDDYASVCAPGEAGCGLECVNICESSRDFPDGSVDVGERCEFDDDCAGSASCDNDVTAATCLCTDPPVNVCENDLKVAFFSPVLGTSCIAADYVQLNRPSPGDFRLKRTCRRVDGTCFESYEEIGIGRRTESETDLCWVDDDDDHRRGRLCGTDFNFAETPASGEYETGVFRFSSNQDFTAQFIIYGSPGGSVVARCTGRGRTDSAGAPPDPPDCTEYDPFGD